MRPGSRSLAELLWGAEPVALALEEPAPAPLTAALARRVESAAKEATTPGAFARWALALRWDVFCTVVRVVAGVARAGPVAH